jgi:hypothetical protein
MGDDSELAVSRVLWDLRDTANDGEAVAWSLPDLLGRLKAAHPTTFTAAWVALSSGRSAGDLDQARRVLETWGFAPTDLQPSGTISDSQPRFSWRAGGIPAHPNDTFTLRVRNLNGNVLLQVTTSATSYQPDAAAWDPIARAQNVTVDVSGGQSTDPASGPFWSHGYRLTVATAVVQEATDWDNLFQTYGDTSGQWNGGDGAESTPLPDGGTAWFFNDSFYGNVARDGTRQLFTNSTPRNMLVIQHGTSMTSIAGPADPYLNPLNLPGTLVPGPDAFNDPRFNLTGGDGMMVGNTLYKFYTVQDSQGGNSAFPDWPVGNALATFGWNGSTLTLSSVGLLGMPQNGISWGIALLNDGGYTYIYGVEDLASPMHKYLHIARVPQGQFTNWSAWQYRSINGWSSSYLASDRIMDWVSDGFSVTKVNGTYVLLTNDTSPWGAGVWSAAAYYASTPDGFVQASKRTIYVPRSSSGIIRYEYRIHPQFSSGSHVLIGYSTNSLNIDYACMPQNDYDARIYRPRFLDVQLPGIAGPSGALTTVNSTAPPAYTTPIVPPEDETWFVTDPSPDSFSSTTCSMTNPAAPPAPSLSATANPDDTISLHWTMSPTAMWIYNLQYHDDTADPTWSQPPASDPNCANAAANGGWCQDPYPMEALSSLTMQFLEPFHVYEYRVKVGPWRANVGTWSNTVTAMAYVTRPTGTPTGLTATVGYGSVHLTWTDDNPNAWFKLFLRDQYGNVTETPDPTPNKSFTWYDLPASPYTFWVVENNQAGDGPPSASVSATPLLCGGITNPPCDHA